MGHLEPTTFAKDAWFYRERGGLLVVAELRKNGAYLGTVQTRIPWSKVAWALRSKPRKLKKKEPPR